MHCCETKFWTDACTDSIPHPSNNYVFLKQTRNTMLTGCWFRFIFSSATRIFVDASHARCVRLRQASSHMLLALRISLSFLPLVSCPWRFKKSFNSLTFINSNASSLLSAIGRLPPELPRSKGPLLSPISASYFGNALYGVGVIFSDIF